MEMHEFVERARGLVQDSTLGYDQKIRQLATLATSAIPTPALSDDAQRALDERVICDMYEGNAPFAPRYVLPDYAKALREGLDYLELAPPETLDDAIAFLQIMYAHVPSVTTYPVYLGELDEVLELEGVTLAHGSPRAPIWEYVVRADIAMENMAAFSTRLCLVGHSHVPVAYWQQHAGRNCIGLQLPEGEPFSYAEGRSLINPGSVGQPRDADPRASYLVLDTSAETVEHRRVAYDIGATQTLMRSRKLFGRNIDRLEYGI